MSHPVGAVFSVAVGIISLGLTALAIAAYRRSADGRLLFLAGAFGAFVVKGILMFVDNRTHALGHDVMEITSTGLDLLVVALLVAPFLKK